MKILEDSAHIGGKLVMSKRGPFHEGLADLRSVFSMIAVKGRDLSAAVTGLAVIGDHVLPLLFTDGTAGDVDLSAERWTGLLEPLNDPSSSRRSE